MITPNAAAGAVSKLSLMAFFPGDPDARGALIWALQQLVDTEDHLDWLVERSLKLYSRWPGIAEIRAVYCSSFRPADGVEGYSEIYESGFPHESTAPAAPPKRATKFCADTEFEAELRQVAQAKRLRPLPGGKGK